MQRVHIGRSIQRPTIRMDNNKNQKNERKNKIKTQAKTKNKQQTHTQILNSPKKIASLLLTPLQLHDIER